VFAGHSEHKELALVTVPEYPKSHRQSEGAWQAVELVIEKAGQETQGEVPETVLKVLAGHAAQVDWREVSDPLYPGSHKQS